MDLIHLQADIY